MTESKVLDADIVAGRKAIRDSGDHIAHRLRIISPVQVGVCNCDDCSTGPLYINLEIIIRAGPTSPITVEQNLEDKKFSLSPQAAEFVPRAMLRHSPLSPPASESNASPIPVSDSRYSDSDL